MQQLPEIVTEITRGTWGEVLEEGERRRRLPAAARVDEPSLRAVVTKALAGGLAAYLCASEERDPASSLELLRSRQGMLHTTACVE